MSIGYFEFIHRTKIIAGDNALEGLPSIMEQLNVQSPILITDKGITGSGILSIVKSVVSRSKIDFKVIYDEIPQDSDVEIVNKISLLYSENQCDSIIAVGGGSVIDTAKGVNILVSKHSRDLMQFQGYYNISGKLNPLIVIPTTCGTGSEVTSVAVLMNHGKGIKMIFASPCLLPDAAIIDSRMLKTLPLTLVASTAMDAMTHAMEAYYCLSKNPLSDRLALRAVALIRENLMEVLKAPDAPQARLWLGVASNLAGLAFCNSMVGMVHTIGHAMGAVCGIPHGLCMSLLLPHGLEYNLKKRKGAIGELLYGVGGIQMFLETPPKERAFKTIECVRGLIQAIHNATEGRYPRSLKELVDQGGRPLIIKDMFPQIARTAINDPSQFYNPEELEYEDVLNVLERAWETP